MNEEQQQMPQVRFRVNVTHTASGKTTWDATCEITSPFSAMLAIDEWREEAIAHSDLIVAAMTERYGPKEQSLEDALKESINAVQAAKGKHDE